MNENNAALRVENLSKRFGEVVAVDGLSLEVRPGEMVGFLGPNGAGKSATLYMITGLVHADAGSVSIFGMDHKKKRVAAMRKVGALVEAPAFYERLSARRNMILLSRLRGRVNHDEIDALLKDVGLYERRRSKVGEFSMGMKQRLGIAAALIGAPQLLLLDEPTNGMDPEATRRVLTMLKKKAADENVAVFLSSHLLYEVEEFCDRAILIHDGRLASSGRVCEILAPHEDVFFVSFKQAAPDAEKLKGSLGLKEVRSISENVLECRTDGRDGAWLNRSLVEAGFDVSALSPRKKSLREYFMEGTGVGSGEASQ